MIILDIAAVFSFIGLLGALLDWQSAMVGERSAWRAGIVLLVMLGLFLLFVVGSIAVEARS